MRQRAHGTRATPIPTTSTIIRDLGSEQMLEKLAQFEHWVPRIVAPVDGVLAEDSQAELERLHEDGFLSKDELDQALDAHG